MAVWQQGGTGSNELLTLAEVAERVGVTDRARPDRRVIAMMRKLEAQTGRRLLVSSGAGHGRRYLVLGRELDAALEGEERVDVDTMADKIARAVQRIENQVGAVAERLNALTARVDRLERRVA